MLRRSLLALSLLLAAALPASAAGTLFGLPLSVQMLNGDPLSGCKLYLYEANSSDPVDAFSDFGLTPGQELTHPIECDSSGRLPQFWVDDGAYRARLTTSGGVEVFDLASVTAIGASTGGGSSGSGSSDEHASFSTGDFLWQPINATRVSWVRANGRTVGSAASGATERANADTGPLYEWLWNNCTDAECPVTGGRGANAAADFSADKPIRTIDMRGRLALGLDTMGNSAASVAAGVETANATGGDDTSTALIAHTHADGTFAAATHTHSFADSDTAPLTLSNATSVRRSGSTVTIKQGEGADVTLVLRNTDSNTIDGTADVDISGTTGSSGSLDVSGATASSGSGSSFSILNPYRAGTWYLKL